MNLPYIDRIWRVKSSLPLVEKLSPAEAFARLDPLFASDNTEYRVEGDTLSYRNRNPAAQNKLATFNRGTLRVSEDGSKLSWDLTSPALMFCFLAPLLFLAFGQFIVALGEFEKPTPAEAAKEEAKAKEEEAKLAKIELNPVDKFLGAPAPEKPKKDDDKKGDKKKGEKDKGEKDKDKGGNKRSPTSAYVLAGIFAFLYLVGRVLEPWLIRRTFRKALAGELPDGLLAPAGK